MHDRSFSPRRPRPPDRHVLYGKVLSRDDKTMSVEIPAHAVSVAAVAFGQTGFCAVIVGQDQRMVRRRVTSMSGATVIGPDAMDLMTLYRYRIELYTMTDDLAVRSSVRDRLFKTLQGGQNPGLSRQYLSSMRAMSPP